MDITKAIIPAAGMGTRFLPYTKAIPKEMLPLGNTPAIQYIVEESMSSGIKDIFIIINKEKVELKKYFDRDDNLEATLATQGKLHLLDSLQVIREKTALRYVEQHKPLGLGHAILMARQHIGENYFGVLLPDDIILHEQPGLAQLISIAQQKKASVIAVQEVPPSQVSAYGVIAIKEQLSSELFEVATMVEKPSIEKAPSMLAVIGRYVLSPALFASLEYVAQHTNTGEIQLTDGISHMMHHQQEKVYAYKIKGARHDTGTPKGWINAIIDIAHATNKKRE